MLGIKKLNISKLKLTREGLEKKREEKKNLCSSRSFDLSSSPCFSLIFLPISPMVVPNGVSEYCVDDNGGMDALFCSPNPSFKDKIKVQNEPNHMGLEKSRRKTNNPGEGGLPRPWQPLRVDRGSHHGPSLPPWAGRVGDWWPELPFLCHCFLLLCP